MNPKILKIAIRSEIDTLCREQLIDNKTRSELLQLYPTGRWDYSSLGKWFLIFGAISTAIGIYILGQSLFVFTLEKLALKRI